MQNKTALIIDNNKLSRIVIRTIIHQYYPDWIIHEAANKGEALARVGDNLDLMTLDLDMPGINGSELVHDFKNRYPNLSVSLFSEAGAGQELDHLLSPDVDIYKKPVTEEKILQSIGSYSLQQNKQPETILQTSELEALAEYFNIGIGKAADSFSQMLGLEVRMSIPAITFASSENAITAMDLVMDDEVVCISEVLQGEISGAAFIIMSEMDSRNLLELCQYSRISSESEFLTEIGNIILNSSLSGIFDLLQSEFDPGLTKFTRQKVVSLLKMLTTDEDSRMLVLDMAMSVESSSRAINFRTMLNLSNYPQLKQRITAISGKYLI